MKKNPLREGTKGMLEDEFPLQPWGKWGVVSLIQVLSEEDSPLVLLVDNY